MGAIDDGTPVVTAVRDEQLLPGGKIPTSKMMPWVRCHAGWGGRPWLAPLTDLVPWTHALCCCQQGGLAVRCACSSFGMGGLVGFAGQAHQLSLS